MLLGNGAIVMVSSYKAVLLNQLGLSPSGAFGNIQSCVWLSYWVCGEVLLGSSGQRLEMLLDTLQCPGQTLSPQQNLPVPDVNSATIEKLVEGLLKIIWYNLLISRLDSEYLNDSRKVRNKSLESNFLDLMPVIIQCYHFF